MAELFQGKYRIPSARKPDWDYKTDAAYFITICTNHHRPWFGKIVRHDEPVETPCMASLQGMSPTLDIETPCMASLQETPPGLDLGTPIVLLSELGEMVQSEWLRTPEIRPDMNLKLGKFVVMPDHFHAILIIGRNGYNFNPGILPMDFDSNSGKYAPQRKNVSSVVRGFKSAVTMFARKNNIVFEWQTRFYDRIIRSGEEYCRIERYIEENPRNWHGK